VNDNHESIVISGSKSERTWKR